MQYTWTTKLLLVGCLFLYFSFAMDVIMIILNRLTEHILKYKTRSHIYMVAHVIRCAYLIFFLHTLHTYVWEVLFFKEQTDSCGRLYDLLLYNIKNRLPLLVAVCLFYSSIFFFSLGGFNDLSMVRMDLFSISNSKWSDYSLNLDSVEWCNAIFRFAYFFLFKSSLI